MKFGSITSDYVFNPPVFDDYVDAVDTSSYRPDSEQIRALKVNPQSGGSTPLYDYPDGIVPKEDNVSSTIVAMRSGRLDRADIDRIKQAIIEDGKAKGENDYAQRLVEGMNKIIFGDGDKAPAAK